MCNFLEGGKSLGFGKDSKIIYRLYATLYFIFVVDSSESELSILDLIHSIVEGLDKIFKSVCELDLVFHMDRVKDLFFKKKTIQKLIIFSFFFVLFSLGSLFN